MRRSKRPGRSSAESSVSGRLVAASTITPSEPVKPSISVRIWLSVCSRSSCPPIAPGPPRWRPIASSSSMKMIDGRRLLGLVEQVAHAARRRRRRPSRRTRDALQREERDVGLAGHRAREQRLARPGLARTGARPSGSRRPGAGSGRGCAGSRRSRRARPRPRRCPRRPRRWCAARTARSAWRATGRGRSGRRATPAAARRNSQMKMPTSSSVGPKPKISVCHSGVPSSIGSALTVTFSRSISSSRPSSPNEGRTVSNLSFFFALPPPSGLYSVFLRNSPWISSPLEVTSLTLPCSI